MDLGFAKLESLSQNPGFPSGNHLSRITMVVLRGYVSVLRNDVLVPVSWMYHVILRVIVGER